MLMTCGGLFPFLCVLLLMINRMMQRHLSSKLRLEVSLKIFSRWEADCIMPFSCWNKSPPNQKPLHFEHLQSEETANWQHCSFRSVLIVFITCFCGTKTVCKLELNTGSPKISSQYPDCFVSLSVFCDGRDFNPCCLSESFIICRGGKTWCMLHCGFTVISCHKLQCFEIQPLVLA